MGGGDPVRSDELLREARAPQRTRLPGALLSARAEPPLWAARGDGALFDVIGIGQNSIDHVCTVDEMPEFAGKAAIRAYDVRPGGQVATAILAAARLGLRTAYVGSVGDDEAGRNALCPLREASVDVSGIKTVSGAPTQHAFIVVHGTSGERTVFWHRDPRLAIAPADLDRDTIASSRALHVDAGDPEAAIWAADVARRTGVPVVLDADAPDPAIEPLLALVDFPIVADTFVEAAFGSDRDALADLIRRGARMAIVTRGRRGATGRIGDRLIESPAFSVEARDTTGAGDAFRGAFVWALLRGEGAASALRFANAAAGMNCRALGAQGGLPTESALLDFVSGESAA